MECKRDKFSGAIDGARETHWKRVSHALNGSFSCKWVKKSTFFSSLFDCICIQKYACKISGRNSENCGNHEFFCHVMLDPRIVFFKLACTITKEQLDIFQKFLYRIKLYSILNRITSRKMWEKIFYPTFLKQIGRKKIKILQILL